MMMTTVAMTNTLKNEEGGHQKICVPTSCQRPLTTECKHCKTSFATTLIKIQQHQKIENTKTQSEIRILYANNLKRPNEDIEKCPNFDQNAKIQKYNLYAKNLLLPNVNIEKHQLPQL